MRNQPQSGYGPVDAKASVLVLDYTGRRREAPVSALGLERQGYTVRYLLEPPFPQELTAAGYAERLWQEHGPFGAEVKAVLAYCMAAPIAQQLLASITATIGGRVPLVLFDGEQATPQSVREQYLVAGDRLGELLDLTESERTVAVTWEADLLRDDPSETVRRMRDGLLELGTRAAAKRPADADGTHAEALVITEFYLDWLIHLVAAHNAEWPAWGGPAVQVVSRDHRCAPDWPGASSTETIRVEATRDELLHDPHVALVVSSILQKGA